MDEVFGTFKSILCSENDYVETYLNELEENYIFHSKGSDEIVRHISSALSKQHTCREGLVFLNCYLKQASLDVLEQKAILWTSLTLRALNSKDNEIVSDLAYSALCNYSWDRADDLEHLTRAHLTRSKRTRLREILTRPAYPMVLIVSMDLMCVDVMSSHRTTDIDD